MGSLENFRELKLSKLETFMVLNFLILVGIISVKKDPSEHTIRGFDYLDVISTFINKN